MYKIEVGSYVQHVLEHSCSVVVELDERWVSVLNVTTNRVSTWQHSMLARKPWVCHKILVDDVKYLVTLKHHLVIDLRQQKVLRRYGNTQLIKEILTNIE